jgi:hypothetical protein
MSLWNAQKATGTRKQDRSLLHPHYTLQELLFQKVTIAKEQSLQLSQKEWCDSSNMLLISLFTEWSTVSSLFFLST